MNAPARKAQFAPNPRRRAMLAKVHLAKKELGLTDDDYRGVVFDVTGRMSAGDATDAQLAAVLEHFKARGFQQKKAAPRKASRADHPMAKKARALWISLHQLGAVRDPKESALEAFACRQLGCAKLQWADQGKSYQLIEALKAMAERAGWSQDLAGVDPANRVYVLRLRLCDALLAKLKKVGTAARHWTLDEAAWSLSGIARRPAHRMWEMGELDAIAQRFGALWREAMPRGGEQA